MYFGISIPAIAALFSIAISWISSLAAQIAFGSLFLIPVYTILFFLAIRLNTINASEEMKSLLEEFPSLNSESK